MRSRAVAYVRRRPVLASLLIVALLIGAASLTAHGAALGRWWLFSNELERASHAPLSGSPVVAEWPIAYRRNLFRVRVHVYPSEVQAARELDTRWVFGSDGTVRERYVRSLVGQQAESRLIAELAARLREIRQRQHLNDDEYLALMVSAVQSIPYGDIRQRIALPAEMLERGDGVCTERTVLLGALMLHEGWETAVLVLDDQRHVALGVGSTTVRYRELPYAFIETTKPARVGDVASVYLAWGPVGDPPHAIPLGGIKRYTGASPDTQALRTSRAPASGPSR